jgi:nitrite reductase/ring-hydroxylating ferredoxin subunit
MRRIAACKAHEMDDDSVLRLDVEGREPLALYKLDGQFYATDALCTHGHAFLFDGMVEQGRIVCPYHLGAFDIRTGAPASPPCIDPIRTYDATVEDETVFVHLAD